ncbi:EAL domain-containing protein [uncultured Jatrophihabitans sp.]|uniref:sensor domain-containing phosphodiesterase n=1 Tax=uncultured Jatrophihabitans sp. TaxID=1610747 RepID=UPI0035CA1EBD
MTAAKPWSPGGRIGSGWSIDAIIDDQAVRTVFQPVVHLATGSIAGFEALSRGPAGTAFESPMTLIQAATQAGRLGELDWLCRTRAMQIAADARLPDTLSWLINVEPAGLAIDCPAHLRAAQERARIDLRVIMEIVERDVNGKVWELIRATDDARLSSWGVALDDVGADEASLALLPFLRPDVVKLDMSLVQGVPHEAAATITAAVRAYAEQRGAVILAEGIETHAHEQLAKIFGATYGQGYYYGRPGPLPDSIETPAAPIPLRQYVAPLDGRTPFEVLATTITPQRAEKQYLSHISSHLEKQAAQDTHASVLLAGFQHKTYFTAAKQARYRQLAAANALTVVLADGLASHDEPTYHIGPLAPHSPLGQEWLVIVLSPHFAAALVARDCGDPSADRNRQFDFIYTHNRDAVIDAARSFTQNLAANPAHRYPPGAVGTAVENMTHGHAEQGSELPGAQLREARKTDMKSRPGRAADDVPGLESFLRMVTADSGGFRAAAQVALNYLRTNMPMAIWSITRVENDRQTHLYLNENDYGLTVGCSQPWQASCCVHMVAGTAPRVAPDAAAVPVYAAAAANAAVQIGAYAGAPIAEPDGSLFGVIFGVDRVPRQDLVQFVPTLDMLAEFLTISLAADRALHAARAESDAVLTYATTDSLTGIRNRHAWDWPDPEN